jgi:hypothetical protein
MATLINGGSGTPGPQGDPGPIGPAGPPVPSVCDARLTLTLAPLEWALATGTCTWYGGVGNNMEVTLWT